MSDYYIIYCIESSMTKINDETAYSQVAYVNLENLLI